MKQKFTIEEHQKRMRAIMNRPRQKTEGQGLLNTLRQAAQKRRPASRIPKLPGA